MVKKTPPHVLATALRILANDIKTDDGVANAALYEAADCIDDLESECSEYKTALRELRETKE